MAAIANESTVACAIPGFTARRRLIRAFAAATRAAGKQRRLLYQIGQNRDHASQMHRKPDRPAMTPIPRSALFLGLAGLIPFLASVATELSPALADLAIRTIGPRFVGPYMALAYGTIILSFMSGVLWGFATKATGQVAAYGYAISVIPALWAFFFVGSGPVSSAIWLSFGFLLLIGLDMMFWQRGLAPSWWIRLRVALTAVVVACLMVTAFGTG